MGLTANAMKDEVGRWWESPRYALLLVLLSAVPLLWPDIAPLMDLPGHMGRYEVQLRAAQSEALRNFYNFEWQLIGNLGLDLLIVPFEKIFGLELGVKLIVLSIPPLTAAGLLLIARVVHGTLPPTAALAVPMAYCFPFHFGFVNFCLAMALAFLAFALWRWLAIRRHFRLRAALFVPLSLILWVVHTFGWGVLGVLAYAAELVRHRDEGKSWFKSMWQAGLDCFPLVPPAGLMILWRTGQVGGETGDWFNWYAKYRWLYMMLRDRWEWLDVGSVIFLALVVLAAIIGALFRVRVSFSRMLALFAVFLGLVFLFLPRIVFGSAYADMRLAPYAFAMALLAIRFRPDFPARGLRWLAMLSLAFFAVRIGATTVSFWLYDQSYDRELAALRHVPREAKMVSFVGRECNEGWTMTRLHHLPGIGIVRRHAFSNDQWSMAGAQLLTVRDLGLGRLDYFSHDPSEVAVPDYCISRAALRISQSLRFFPRDFFDYVWVIDARRTDPDSERGLQAIWRNGDSALYRVVRTPPAPMPAAEESE